METCLRSPDDALLTSSDQSRDKQASRKRPRRRETRFYGNGSPLVTSKESRIGPALRDGLPDPDSSLRRSRNSHVGG